MNYPDFSEWLAPLSVAERTRALATIYSSLTVNTRELFIPEASKGREATIMEALHGINELHHTLANQLLAYVCDEAGYSIENLGRQLLDIANRYRIVGLLSSAVEFAQSRAVEPR